MKGTTESGDKLNLRTPGMTQTESVPSAKNIDGQTNQSNVKASRSSNTAGFSVSRKCGTIKGETHTGDLSG